MQLARRGSGALAIWYVLVIYRSQRRDLDHLLAFSFTQRRLSPTWSVLVSHWVANKLLRQPEPRGSATPLGFRKKRAQLAAQA